MSGHYDTNFSLTRAVYWEGQAEKYTRIAAEEETKGDTFAARRYADWAKRDANTALSERREWFARVLYVAIIPLAEAGRPIASRLTMASDVTILDMAIEELEGIAGQGRIAQEVREVRDWLAIGDNHARMVASL